MYVIIIINYQFKSPINATFVSSKVQPHHHLIQMKRLTGEVSVSSKIPDQNLFQSDDTPNKCTCCDLKIK